MADRMPRRRAFGQAFREKVLGRTARFRGRKSVTTTNVAANQSARSSLALAGLRDVCTVNFVDCWQSPQSPRHIPKCTTYYKSDTNLYQTMRGHTKTYERVPKYTTVSSGMRKIYPRMKSDSEANPISRPEVRGAT